MQLRRNLRRHALGRGAGGVIAGREQIEGKAALGVSDRGVALSGRKVDRNDARLGNAASGGINHSSAKGAGSSVLRAGGAGKHQDGGRSERDCHKPDRDEPNSREPDNHSMRAVRHRHSPSVV